jgi:TolB protein
MTRRDILTCLLLAGLACAVALRTGALPSLAADSERETWGASDPTWSPDGGSLAFSLFGSIWHVAADGGVARQVTTSSGYHGHAAWSPQGDKIAFIKSAKPPYHRTLNISGKLVLVNAATGAEQEITTPYATAGNPAWSPDGTAIACGLRTPDAALLHVIRIADGKVRQVQFPISSLLRNTSAINTWVDAAWSRGRDEIFFGAFRTETPQIWSMPSAAHPIVVQMPLTNYRADDIASFMGVAALPDGSGVIYSGDVVNGKGDYELYRVPRQGGVPVNLTNTTRDEFSPAVSPDGKRIAFVSNFMGNIDLFTMPVSGGAAQHIPISGLEFRGGSGRAHVRLLDEMGRPTSARLYVRAADSKAYCPPGSPLYFFPVDPGEDPQGFFIADGDDTFPVPAGRLRLVARKGVEYRVVERAVDIAAGDTAEIAITLERWTNWTQRGWYSGENHFHANYNGYYYQRPPQSLGWLKAEDLNVANMLVANSTGAFVHDKEFFRGAPDPLSGDRYILSWGQEYRNSNPYGHMCFLNVKKQIQPSYTSVPGSRSPYDFPLNTMAALEAHKQGALVDYTHPLADGYNDVFDNTYGAKELPIAAALGAVDFIDILPWGEQAYELWYSTLNCGFKIVPGAGTDTFTNYRGITRLPGAARQYVETGPGLDWNRWLDRYRQGRTFVTNAPLLTFTVNGQPIGSVIRIPEGSRYLARLVADATADIPLTRVELIQNGRVVESRTAQAGARAIRIEKEIAVEGSCWFAVRVLGEPTRGGPGLSRAHSGAIYVDAGGKPTLVREDLELMVRMIDRLWTYVVERNNFGLGDNRRRAREMFDQARAHYVSKLAQAR